MTPGRLVRRTRDGAVARVVRLEDEVLIVEIDGEERRWGVTSCRGVLQERAPRGLAKATAPQVEALRMVVAGVSRKEIAVHLGVPVGRVNDWITRAREAAEDARNLAEVRHG